MVIIINELFPRQTILRKQCNRKHWESSSPSGQQLSRQTLPEVCVLNLKASPFSERARQRLISVCFWSNVSYSVSSLPTQPALCLIVTHMFQEEPKHQYGRQDGKKRPCPIHQGPGRVSVL